jgi:DNA-binding MarR family transcriptional regulator
MPEPISLPYLILDALPLAMRVIAAQVRGTTHNLHAGHLPVLATLNIRPYAQSDLAEIMSVSGATMSNTLAALEERGWVERVRSETDRRVFHVRLTSAGVKAYEETMQEMEAQLNGLLEHLDEGTRAELRRGLIVLREVFARALGDEERRDP